MNFFVFQGSVAGQTFESFCKIIGRIEGEQLGDAADGQIAFPEQPFCPFDFEVREIGHDRSARFRLKPTEEIGTIIVEPFAQIVDAEGIADIFVQKFRDACGELSLRVFAEEERLVVGCGDFFSQDADQEDFQQIPDELRSARCAFFPERKFLHGGV